MKYVENESGLIKTEEEVRKEYKEIAGNTNFKKEGIEGWDNFEEFLKDQYTEVIEE